MKCDPSNPLRIRAMLAAASLVCLAVPVWGQGNAPEPKPLAQPVQPDTSITIYSTAAPGAIPPERYRPTPSGQPVYYDPYQNSPLPGYAVVRQIRNIALDAGRGPVRFSDVAAYIDPTTVSFTSLTDPAGTRVLEQNYQFDLVSGQKLLERFLDKQITVESRSDKETVSTTGTLMSAGGAGAGLILKLADGRIQMVNQYSNVVFPTLPEGLITKPTLVWDVQAQKPGPHRAQVSYQTTGITWWADYNIVFSEGKDANSCSLDVGAWVSIINQSGATYPDAKLKLIAGDVHRAPPPGQPRGGGFADRRELAASVTNETGFQEKGFFEYHLYTLGRTTTLPENSTKQIELFAPVSKVPAEKVLVYYGLEQGSYWFMAEPAMDRNFGNQSNKKVDIYLSFKNSKENSMGMPLPSGRIRVSKLDTADNSLEFIGEDTIDHTPKDETVLIKLGSAFDVVGERRQVDFAVDTRGHWIDETIEIKIRNHKAEPVKVIIKENAYRWVNWEIKQFSHPFEKADARTIHFPVNVEKDGEVTVQYKIHYSW